LSLAIGERRLQAHLLEHRGAGSLLRRDLLLFLRLLRLTLGGRLFLLLGLLAAFFRPQHGLGHDRLAERLLAAAIVADAARLALGLAKVETDQHRATSGRL